MHIDPFLIKKIQYNTSWDSFWLQKTHVYMFLDPRGAKMAPQEAPIKYGDMAPSREPFWLC